MIKRVLTGSYFLLVGNLGSKVLLFVFNIWLARELGPEHFGAYSFVLGITVLLTWNSMFGLQAALLWSLPKAETSIERDRLITQSMVFILGSSSLLALFLTFLPTAFINDEALVGSVNQMLVFFALSIPFISLNRLLGLCLQASNKMLQASLVFHLLRVVFLTFFMFIGYSFTSTLYGLAFGFMLASIVMLVYALIVSENKLIFTKGRGSERFLEMLVYAVPIFISGVFFQIMVQYPNFIIASQMNSSDIGIFNAAMLIGMQVLIIGGAMSASILPVVAEFESKGKRKMSIKTLLFGNRLLFTILFPVFIVITEFSTEIMSLYGSDYSSGSDVLKIVGGAWVLYYMKGGIAEYLQVTNQQKLDVYNHIAALIVVVVSSFYFWSYGIVGVAYSVCAGIISMAILEVVELYVVDQVFALREVPFGLVVYAVIVVLLFSIFDGYTIELFSVFVVIYLMVIYKTLEEANRAKVINFFIGKV